MSTETIGLIRDGEKGVGGGGGEGGMEVLKYSLDFICIFKADSWVHRLA